MLKITHYFSFHAIINQLSKTWKTIIIGIIISFGGTGFTILVAKLTDNPIWKLTRDPASVVWYPPYIGMLSNWDVILWIATATICLFSAVLFKQLKVPKPTLRFLETSGIFSLFLGLDDLFMLHEQLLPRMLDIPEIFFYAMYFFFFIAYLAYFTSQILRYDYLLFMAAFLFFVISRQSFFGNPYFRVSFPISDILKYFGIVFWLAFFYRTALHEGYALLSLQKPTRLTSD